VVSEARKLIGIWYDPLKGQLGNLSGRLGFIVCMDVPVIAYRNAGASLRRLLEADYAVHPEHYDPRDGGKPGDPFFHRRARNLYSYCKNIGRLDMAGPPRPGDVVFMSRKPKSSITHIALVSRVEPNGQYLVVEASTYGTREVRSEDLARRGWLFRGFGEVLGEQGYGGPDEHRDHDRCRVCGRRRAPCSTQL
jgi:uncharacterized protein YijF (DUF1287 family)